MKFNRNVYHSFMMISQFGINMLVPIFLCSFLGMYIDKKCGTTFWIVILFFAGAIAGGTNVFRFAKKIYEEPAVTRKHMKAGQEEEKDGKKKNGKIKIDATLFDLSLGIFLYGIVCQIIILFFSRMPEYSIGLWIGVVLAVIGSVHMWWTLSRSLEMASKDAMKTVGTQYLVRYLIIVIAMAILAVSGFANPLFAFLGYMGMKVSAYMQPFTRKISSKVFKI